MANGAIGSITYLAGGDKRYPRERVEVFDGGAVGVTVSWAEKRPIRGTQKGEKRIGEVTIQARRSWESSWGPSVSRSAPKRARRGLAERLPERTFGWEGGVVELSDSPLRSEDYI